MATIRMLFLFLDNIDKINFTKLDVDKYDKNE